MELALLSPAARATDAVGELDRPPAILRLMEGVERSLTSDNSRRAYPNFRPHDARRTCARLCRTGNAALEDLQELLGHSSIQTTERYLGRTEGFKRAITDIIGAPNPSV